MKNIASETIKGSYTVMEMPDGQIVLMEKLSDGQWVRVEERINELSITDNFKDTQTKPHDWKEPTSENVFRKNTKSNIEDVIKGNSTIRHLYGKLVEVIGSPTEVIKNNKLSHEIKDPSIFRLVMAIAEPLKSYTPCDKVYDIIKKGWKGY